ncbi:MAG TPA: hypothetical protein VNJ29_00540 [Candidatus Nitrosotenuis sp.]|jgi:hypothetical protein|nr:hypothetical protein [Candidatus Nitrosotenuis sp.]
MLKVRQITYILLSIGFVVGTLNTVHGQEKEVDSGSSCTSVRPRIAYNDGKELRVYHSIEAHQIPFLKGNHTKIYLNGVCKKTYTEGHKYPKITSIPFSPQILSPNVVELSLMSCLLTDEDICHLNEFTNLKILRLEANLVTDASIPMIAQMTGIEELSLCSKFTDAAVPLILGMPNLTILDLSSNREITNKSAELLKTPKLQKLRILGTGMKYKVERDVRQYHYKRSKNKGGTAT